MKLNNSLFQRCALFVFFLLQISLVIAKQAPPANDDKINAELIVLDNVGEYCGSSNNSTATADFTQNIPSNWQAAPYKNVWFKFKPKTDGLIQINAKPGGGRRLRTVIYDDNDNEVHSSGYISTYANSKLSVSGLDTSRYYFVAVDVRARYGFYGGTFTLCFSQGQDHDYKEYAKELTLDVDGKYCGSGDDFDNRDASIESTDVRPSNWGSGPHKNIWYKFKPDVNGIAKITAIPGYGRKLMTALYDDQGQEIESAGYAGVYNTRIISAEGLDATKFYYIAVDINMGYGFVGGGFTLCIKSEFDFDYKDYAKEIVLDQNGEYCSANSEFDNSRASADPTDIRPNNWTSGPFKNVWFKFKPAANGKAAINVKPGYGKRLMSALYDDAGNEITSLGYIDTYAKSNLLAEGLDPNRYYFLEVDVAMTYAFYGGTFSLCISDDPGFDFKEYAYTINLDENNQYVSNGTEFNNLNASADYGELLSWSGGPDYNVWFKFTPDTNGDVTFTVTRGTINNIRTALLDDQDNELISLSHVSGDQILTATDLVAGTDYYLSVDTNMGFRKYGGTFGLSVSFVPNVCVNELWAISSGDWNDPSIWSATEGGTPIGGIPCDLSMVYIKGFQVSFDTGENSLVKRIELVGTDINTNTGLLIRSGSLHTVEEVKVSGPGTQLLVTTGASIKVTGGGG